MTPSMRIVSPPATSIAFLKARRRPNCRYRRRRNTKPCSTSHGAGGCEWGTIHSPCRLVPHSLLRTHRGQRPRSAFERFIPARAGGTLYRTYFAKKMLTYLEASRQQRYIHERWPVSKRVNSSRASGDDSTLIERSRDDSKLCVFWRSRKSANLDASSGVR